MFPHLPSLTPFFRLNKIVCDANSSQKKLRESEYPQITRIPVLTGKGASKLNTND